MLETPVNGNGLEAQRAWVAAVCETPPRWRQAMLGGLLPPEGHGGPSLTLMRLSAIHVRGCCPFRPPQNGHAVSQGPDRSHKETHHGKTCSQRLAFVRITSDRWSSKKTRG